MSSGNQRYINTAGSHDITMNDDYINVSTSVGAITLVFPNIRDSGAIPTNKVWFVNDVDDMAATNNVTIVASDTSPVTELNGGTSVVLDTNGFSAEIVPSGYYNYMVNSGISDGGMTGSGTLNYVAKFTPSGTVLGNSQLFDNGSSVGLGTILPSADTKFHIKGIDNTSNNFSLKIDGLASNTPLLYVRNDGLSTFNSQAAISAQYGSIAQFTKDPSVFPTTQLADIGIGFGTTNFLRMGIWGNYTGISSDYTSKATFSIGNLTTFKGMSFVLPSGVSEGFEFNIDDFSIGNASTALYINTSKNVGIGTRTLTARLQVQGIDATSSNFALKVDNSASAPLLYVRNDGRISMNNLPTSNAGLSSGDLYVSSAADILANGDLVVGRKV